MSEARSQAVAPVAVVGERGAEARRGDWSVLLSALCFSTMPIFGTLAYAAGVGVLALAASLLYSGFLLVATPLIRGTDAVLATAWIMSVCALGYLTAALFQETLTPPRTVAAWGPILGIAAVATVMSDVSFFWGLPRTGASRAAILSTVEPLCTLARPAPLLGEAIPSARFAGGILLLASV